MCSSSPIPATAPTCPIPTQARSTASTKRFVLTTFTHGAAPIDDEIHALFAARKAGFLLVLVADSCHSGMVTRAAASDPDADDGPRPLFMPIGNWLPAEQLPKAASRKPLSALAVTAASSAFSGAASRLAGDLLLSGCKEGPNTTSAMTPASGSARTGLSPTTH